MRNNPNVMGWFLQYRLCFTETPSGMRNKSVRMLPVFLLHFWSTFLYRKMVYFLCYKYICSGGQTAPTESTRSQATSTPGLDANYAPTAELRVSRATCRPRPLVFQDGFVDLDNGVRGDREMVVKLPFLLFVTQRAQDAVSCCCVLAPADSSCLDAGSYLFVFPVGLATQRLVCPFAS
jgi:hypothetical protein